MEQAEQPTFETERIQELKNERIYLQKKIFTKWMNTFLQVCRRVFTGLAMNVCQKVVKSHL